MSEHPRVIEAQTILKALGFDKARSGRRSALTLLALLDLEPAQPWTEAKNVTLGVSGIMAFSNRVYGATYKTGTRESFRKYTLHQFVEAGMVAYSDDDPDKPVNSPLNNYRLTDEAFMLLSDFGTLGFADVLAEYLVAAPGLKALYAAAREGARIPVTLPDGTAVTLSAGGQNVLISQIVEDFCGYFTPGGHVLYVGDADAKMAIFDAAAFSALGLSFDFHGKFPDLVVYLPDKNWLVLMEAVYSSGPVDAKRYAELKELFGPSSAGLVYVSCFPDRRSMKKFLPDLAWETEAWNADEPTHLIHLNGSRFLGPY